MTATDEAAQEPDGTPANVTGRTLISAREETEAEAEASADGDATAEEVGQPHADMEPEERADALDAEEPVSGTPGERDERTQHQDPTALDAPD